jgi:hypothetical protein
MLEKLFGTGDGWSSDLCREPSEQAHPTFYLGTMKLRWPILKRARLNNALDHKQRIEKAPTICGRGSA